MTSDALVSLAFLTLLICFAYGPWQWLWTDIARQTMFEKRDQLFDMALAGRLDFASDEYRTIRASLEQTIRFAHLMTLPRLIFSKLTTGRIGRTETSRMERALARISDPQTRLEVRSVIDGADDVMICAIAAKSPLFLLVMAPIAAILVVATVIARLCGYDLRRPGAFIRQMTARLGAYVHEEAEAGFPA